MGVEGLVDGGGVVVDVAGVNGETRSFGACVRRGEGGGVGVRGYI